MPVFCLVQNYCPYILKIVPVRQIKKKRKNPHLCNQQQHLRDNHNFAGSSHTQERAHTEEPGIKCARFLPFPHDQHSLQAAHPHCSDTDGAKHSQLHRWYLHLTQTAATPYSTVVLQMEVKNTHLIPS